MIIEKVKHKNNCSKCEKERVVNRLLGKKICEDCGEEINEMFRFTDWEKDFNDRIGIYKKCLKLFNKAVKENPEGRYSIYDISECKCGIRDEGVLFNEKCPEYKTGSN